VGRLETTGYCALGAPLYAALIAVEYAVARYRKHLCSASPTPSAT